MSEKKKENEGKELKIACYQVIKKCFISTTTQEIKPWRFLFAKEPQRGWRDGLLVKSTCCSQLMGTWVWLLTTSITGESDGLFWPPQAPGT